MTQTNARLIVVAGLLAVLTACSYFRPMPRVRPGTDMALPDDPSLAGAILGVAVGCTGPDVGPVQVRNGDPIKCASSQKDTLVATAPAGPVKKP